MAVDLRVRLGIPPREIDVLPLNVVLRKDDGAVSLLVDEIGDVIEVDDNNFERPPETIRGITRELLLGVYKLKDQLLLILDTDKVLTVEST